MADLSIIAGGRRAQQEAILGKDGEQVVRCPVGRSKCCKIQSPRGSVHSSPLGQGVLGSGYMGQ